MKEFNTLNELIGAYKAKTKNQTFLVNTIPSYDMAYFYRINIDSRAYIIQDFGYVKTNCIFTKHNAASLNHRIDAR